VQVIAERSHPGIVKPRSRLAPHPVEGSKYERAEADLSVRRLTRTVVDTKLDTRRKECKGIELTEPGLPVAGPRMV